MCNVDNFDQERALGAGWRDRPYQPGEEQTPDEPLVEVEEILHKSRSKLLQELLDFLVLRACSIADPHEQQRSLKSIPADLTSSGVWLDREAKAQKAQNTEEMSDQYSRLSTVDLHTRINYAKLRSELVDTVNVAKYDAALEEVERRNAPPPSLAALSLAAQERNNALLQQLIEIQKRPSAPLLPKEEVPIEDDPPPPRPGKKPRKKQKAVIINQTVLKAALEQLNSKKGNLRLDDPRVLAKQLEGMSGAECPSAATWLNVLDQKPMRQDVVERLVRFFKTFEITVDKRKLIAKYENE
jgi:hypothetical protein